MGPVKFLVLLICSNFVESANILGVFASQSPSHLIVHLNTIRPMIERGHNVTIVTSIPVNEPNLKFNHILLDLPEFDVASFNETKNTLWSELKIFYKFIQDTIAEGNATLNHPKMKKLMAEESFDLVIAEYFFNDFVVGLGAHFNCPLIINWMAKPIRNLVNLVGNPAEISYVPTPFSGLEQPLGFLARVGNVFSLILDSAVFSIMDIPMRRYYDYSILLANSYLKLQFTGSFEQAMLSAVLALLLIVSLQCDSANILGFFPSNSKSHLIIHMSTIQPMIERGHNVTVVTSIPVDEPNLNFHHIQLDLPPVKFNTSGKSNIKIVNTLMSYYSVARASQEECNNTLNHPKVKELMAKGEFDLVIAEYFFNDFIVGLGGHFKCPLIINWMRTNVRNLANMVGNPAEPLYVPTWFSGLYQPMGFIARVKNIFATVFDLTLMQIVEYKMETFYHFNFPPDKYPSYDEAKKSVSLLFVNSFRTFVQPNVPALIEIGGIQIKPQIDPLPKDLRSFLDSAGKDGAIYFCLGSNVNKKFLSDGFIEQIYNVLSKMKQKIVWKWTDDVPGNSSNILYSKWLPQNDLLAHPNIKLFITHGGAGGIAEAQYHGVPMVGIPFFGDQFANMQNIENVGHGLKVLREKMTEESFHAAVTEVLENPKYKKNVERFSVFYRDRPMSARDTAVYWMEYVIRHKGAKHLQSPAVHMNTFQYYGLDVIAFLLVIIYAVCKLIAFIFKRTLGILLGKCFGSKKSVAKNKKNQ